MISCILLAGGQSKRMGKDKAFLKLQDKTFLRLILESVDNYCDEIVIVGNKEKKVYLKEAENLKASIKFTKDLYPYQGPLNGIISAVDHISADYVFVATCDTPLIKGQIISLLQSYIDDYDTVVPVINGKIQPLNTLYKKLSLKKAKDLFLSGERSLFSLIQSLNTRYLDENCIRSIDKNLSSYWSINTPQDYEKLIQLYQ